MSLSTPMHSVSSISTFLQSSTPQSDPNHASAPSFDSVLQDQILAGDIHDSSTKQGETNKNNEASATETPVTDNTLNNNQPLELLNVMMASQGVIKNSRSDTLIDQRFQSTADNNSAILDQLSFNMDVRSRSEQQNLKDILEGDGNNSSTRLTNLELQSKLNASLDSEAEIVLNSFSETLKQQTEFESSQNIQNLPPQPDQHIDSFAANISQLGLISSEANTINQPNSKAHAIAEFNVATPFKDSGWNEAVGDRIVWMANHQIQSAQLNINPEHLGPIQINIAIDAQNLTNVQFIASQPEVRQALVDSMPQLNALFQESGLSLGQSNVGSQSNQQQFFVESKAENTNTETGDSSDSVTSVRSITMGNGIINTFA